MTIFITGLHIALCFFLILVVLLQPGKGADFGAAMGGTSQAMNQATGPAGVLSKVTAIVAAMFMVTSMMLAYFSNQPEATDIGFDDLAKELSVETGAGTEGTEAAPPAEPTVEPAPPADEAPAADEAAPPEGEGETAPDESSETAPE